MAEPRILLDSGPLVALLAASDSQHQVCLETLAKLRPPLLTCWPVLTEVAWLLRKQPSPVARLAEAQSAGLFEFLTLDGESLNAIAVIMARYKSAGLQFADAALVHLAERENIRTVFTLDRRDFSIVRLKGKRPLKLLPDLG